MIRIIQCLNPISFFFVIRRQQRTLRSRSWIISSMLELPTIFLLWVFWRIYNHISIILNRQLPLWRQVGHHWRSLQLILRYFSPWRSLLTRHFDLFEVRWLERRGTAHAQLSDRVRNCWVILLVMRLGILHPLNILNDFVVVIDIRGVCHLHNTINATRNISHVAAFAAAQLMVQTQLWVAFVLLAEARVHIDVLQIGGILRLLDWHFWLRDGWQVDRHTVTFLAKLLSWRCPRTSIDSRRSSLINSSRGRCCCLPTIQFLSNLSDGLLSNRICCFFESFDLEIQPLDVCVLRFYLHFAPLNHLFKHFYFTFRSLHLLLHRLNLLLQGLP